MLSTTRQQLILRGCKDPIPTIPALYPLQRLNLLVVYANPLGVINRISEYVRTNSLAAKWQKGCSNKILCTTNTSLTIEICLWRQASVHKGRPNAVIVDVNRCKGDSIEFHRIKSLLFDAIDGGTRSKRQRVPRTEKSLVLTTMKLKNLSVRGPLTLNGLGNLLKAVSVACNLMSGRTTAEVVAGIKLLIFLTDMRLTNRVYATHVGNMILTGKNPFGHRVDTKELLYRHALDDGTEDYHRYVVRAIGNSFKLVQDSSALKKPDLMDLWAGILPRLFLDMDNVDEDPHTAHDAARCLRAMITLDKTENVIFEKAKSGDRVTQVISYLISYGKLHNAKIERVSRALVILLKDGV